MTNILTNQYDDGFFAYQVIRQWFAPPDRIARYTIQNTIYTALTLSFIRPLLLYLFLAPFYYCLRSNNTKWRFIVSLPLLIPFALWGIPGCVIRILDLIIQNTVCRIPWQKLWSAQSKHYVKNYALRIQNAIEHKAPYHPHSLLFKSRHCPIFTKAQYKQFITTTMSSDDDSANGLKSVLNYIPVQFRSELFSDILLQVHQHPDPKKTLEIICNHTYCPALDAKAFTETIKNIMTHDVSNRLEATLYMLNHRKCPIPLDKGAFAEMIQHIITHTNDNDLAYPHPHQAFTLLSHTACPDGLDLPWFVNCYVEAADASANKAQQFNKFIDWAIYNRNLDAFFLFLEHDKALVLSWYQRDAIIKLCLQLGCHDKILRRLDHKDLRCGNAHSVDAFYTILKYALDTGKPDIALKFANHATCPKSISDASSLKIYQALLDKMPLNAIIELLDKSPPILDEDGNPTNNDVMMSGYIFAKALSLYDINTATCILNHKNFPKLTKDAYLLVLFNTIARGQFAPAKTMLALTASEEKIDSFDPSHDDYIRIYTHTILTLVKHCNVEGVQCLLKGKEQGNPHQPDSFNTNYYHEAMLEAITQGQKGIPALIALLNHDKNPIIHAPDSEEKLREYLEKAIIENNANGLLAILKTKPYQQLDLNKLLALFPSYLRYSNIQQYNDAFAAFYSVAYDRGLKLSQIPREIQASFAERRQAMALVTTEMDTFATKIAQEYREGKPNALSSPASKFPNDTLLHIATFCHGMGPKAKTPEIQGITIGECVAAKRKRAL